MPIMIFIAICISGLFGFSELILTIIKRSSGESAEKRKDRGSAILLWLIITAGLTFGFMLAYKKEWHLVNYLIASLGIVSALFGLAIRWIAILQLNKEFTVDVAINNDHRLKTDGIYSMVRHPSYLGLLLIMTGEALAMNSVLSFIIIVLPFSFAVWYRIMVEEKLLEEKFGEEYRDYRRKTGAIMPS